MLTVPSSRPGESRSAGGRSSHAPAGVPGVWRTSRAGLASSSAPAASNASRRAGIGEAVVLIAWSAGEIRASLHVPVANQALPSGATATSKPPSLGRR